MDGITHDDIVQSLNPADNRDMVFKAGESQGKSGSFFFFSHDKKYIIKTMTEGDLATFKNLFKDYAQHILTHPQSFLARIYGIYTIKMEDIEPVHVVLMASTKMVGNDKNIMKVFDLKGSFVNRLQVAKPG